MTLNGYTALTFQVHIVQHLLLQISLRNRAGELQQTVGQGAFSMVDMCNDTEVSDVLHRSQKYDLFYDFF